MHLHSADGTVDLLELSERQPIIVVRYLGYTCSHCVEQLTYLNSKAARLKELDVPVFAFSEDSVARNSLLAARMQYDSEAMHLLSDPDNDVARIIGAMPTIQDTARDLHVSMVIYQRKVVLANYTEVPYLDVERLVAAAVNSRGKGLLETQTGDAHPTDKYLTGPVKVTVVAGPADGIVGPIDLDFNQSPLHPDDLWVVTTSYPGHGVAIVHHATDEKQRAVTLKKDSRASHFMWRTQAIAMGDNGTFATAQSGAPGEQNPFYQFMGPTLWSADTAVFASRYQSDSRVLASHLDMLHQSPQNLGIAHDHDNVYWVSDGYYKDITRYDFRDPHEVGGTDHRDGIIRRYTDVQVTKGEYGEPGHIAFDAATGWLYIVDPGGNRLLRLDTRSGKFLRNLVPADESSENLAEYSEWTGASVDTLVTTGLGEPCGIALDANRLFVGDRSSGNINVFNITGSGVELLGVIKTGAQELLGICYGPDQRLWFVDRKAGTICRLGAEGGHTLRAVADVQVVDRKDELVFEYTNNAKAQREVLLVAEQQTITADGTGPTVNRQPLAPIVVAGGATTKVRVSITVEDSLHAWRYTVREDDGTTTGGAYASTVVVPRSVRRVITDDALMETFRITEAVSQTSREGYVSLRSDVFVRASDSLPQLQTVLWNGGSFGEINPTEDAILGSLLDRKVNLMVVADDPLLLRTDFPGSSTFFRRLGVYLIGAERQVDDAGQRLFRGVPGDTISSDLGLVDCQLPRLDHHRGVYFVPNVLFQSAEDSCLPILTNESSTNTSAYRFLAQGYKSVLLGMNAQRFLDGSQRTVFLDRSLQWLERPEVADTSVDTTTGVADDRTSFPVEIKVLGNGTSDNVTIHVSGSSRALQLGVYAATGQMLEQLHNGPIEGELTFGLDRQRFAAGTLFVIARTPDGVRHRTIAKW
jgi:peroxiredoxin/sugar lactone lactonase YvrE